MLIDQRKLFFGVVAVFSLLTTGSVYGLQEQEQEVELEVQLQAAAESSAAEATDCKECENCKDGECNCAEADSPTGADDDSASFKSTHMQSDILTPQIDGKPARLSTFRVRPDGNLVACVASGQQGGFVHVYSPDFELLDEIEIPFHASALDLDQSGNLYVAGSGKIMKLSSAGKVLLSTDSPSLSGVDLEELKQEIREESKKQLEQTQAALQKQIDKYQKQIADIESVDEDERTKSQKSKLTMLQARIGSYEQILEQQAGMSEQMIEFRLQATANITAIAVAEPDVFVATSARSGSGYEVYRLNTELEEPERIIKGLRGCCGQMDIHASEGRVYIAENTKYKVGVYDRDGESLASFGERLSKDNQGFGSCCNPMNVYCCANGEILTAESSIGKIKRFDADGNMTGYIGRARIGGGCKHVAFGFDEERDRYYVQYEDENQICVLTPVAATSEKAVDPKLSELSGRLTQGRWTLAAAAGNEGISESIEGIGLQLGTGDQGEILVAGVIENSPAAKSDRLGAGDVILNIGEAGDKMTSTAELDLQQVSEMLRGTVGTRVMLRYRSAKTDKVRRTSLRRVRMNRVDGKWQIAKNNRPANADPLENLTKMNAFVFQKNGTVETEMEHGDFAGMQDPGYTWLATGVEDDTLLLDIESGEAVITYRVKVKFVDAGQARIAVSYDGLGEEGEFRDYRLVPLEKSARVSRSGAR